MQDLILLCDGSVHAQSRIGYGAYLAVAEPGLSLEALKSHVRVKRFTQTSSTKLELQILLWALSDVQRPGRKVIVYTDSQNIINLPDRREGLERKAYYSGKNRLLNNHELYQAFYRLTDRLDYELVKVRGHLRSKQKDEMDQLFTFVDRASRQALRAEAETGVFKRDT